MKNKGQTVAALWDRRRPIVSLDITSTDNLLIDSSHYHHDVITKPTRDITASSPIHSTIHRDFCDVITDSCCNLHATRGRAYLVTAGEKWLERDVARRHVKHVADATSLRTDWYARVTWYEQVMRWRHSTPEMNLQCRRIRRHRHQYRSVVWRTWAALWMKRHYGALSSTSLISAGNDVPNHAVSEVI